MIKEADVVDLNELRDISLEMYSVRLRKDTPDAPVVVERVGLPREVAGRSRSRSEGCTGGVGSIGRRAVWVEM